jgi:hypothetical protein
MSILKLQQQNVAAPTAFTEYSLAIPPGIKEVTLNLRLADVLYIYAATTNGSNPGSSSNLPTVYSTLAAGASRTFHILGAQTIYFQVGTSQSTQTLEIDYYGDN